MMPLSQIKRRGLLWALAAGLWVAEGSAAAIKMEEMEVEGDVHKPQVLFISERSFEFPHGEGSERLRTDFLSEVVADGRRLARERNLPATELKNEAR